MKNNVDKLTFPSYILSISIVSGLLNQLVSVFKNFGKYFKNCVDKFSKPSIIKDVEGKAFYINKLKD